eukprot:SAG31_NODE_4421_length_3249_cov_2.958730_2_plen_95_part_00
MRIVQCMPTVRREQPDNMAVEHVRREIVRAEVVTVFHGTAHWRPRQVHARADRSAVHHEREAHWAKGGAEIWQPDHDPAAYPGCHHVHPAFRRI